MKTMFAVFFALIALSVPTQSEERSSDPLAASLGRVAGFSLPSVDGGSISFLPDDRADYTVLCFLGTECPLAKVYGSRLESMAQRFADQGVKFIGINSNIQDSIEEIREYASAHGIGFPILKDYDCKIAIDAGATRTPEIVVVDRFGVVRYRGRIDNQYEPGIARAEATQHDLVDAIEALVAGRKLTSPQTTAVGCLIAMPRKKQTDATVTYCDQVSRVLQRNCVECHREGEIGPFVLDDFDELVGWADMSIEVIDNGRMPPWHATDDHAEIANARSMPETDKQLLRDWVEAGMPYGDASNLPELTTHVAGWQLPKSPDLVLPMSKTPFEIPADETVEYQYYVVDPGFETDRWVKAAEVVPGNRAAVHHAIAFIRPPDGADYRDFGMLSAYVPGQRRSPLPAGYAQRVAAGSRIVFQMHYTPTGKTETDLSRIAIVFADDDEVTHEVITMGGVEQDFEIPPGAKSHVVEGAINNFPRDGVLLSVMPHMHLRGKSFQFAVERSNENQTLLEVPHYDFNWQHSYELRVPLPLADVERLSFTATFDNSANNPTNPDATEYVTWGDQTWQEMAVTFIGVAVPRERETKSNRHERLDRTPSNEKAQQFAADYMKRFDANEDGFIVEHELPHSVRLFSFRDFDHDNDDRISSSEIQSEASWRFNQ